MQKVERVSFTRRFLDRAKNPPEYVDEELPTKTVQIFAREKQGTYIIAGDGALNMGSIRFSGSHYDFAPGSYALRVLRRSVSYGSMSTGGQLNWCLRHSRLGTVEKLTFHNADKSPLVDHGGPMNPLYSFGPGTVTAYMQSVVGSHRIASSLEGIF